MSSLYGDAREPDRSLDQSHPGRFSKQLASEMVGSYTDLAAQNAVTRGEHLQTISPPPVPEGIPRFTSRGIAHTFSEAFPPYLQLRVSFVEGTPPTMLENIDPKSVASETSPTSSRPSKNDNLSVLHKRNLQATPLRMHTVRSGFEIRGKEKGMPDYEYDNPGSSADKRPTRLIAMRGVCEVEDTSQADSESSDQATSPSLISSSQVHDIFVKL